MNFYRANYSAFVRQIKSMKILPRILLVVLAGGSLSFFAQQAQAQGVPITGNITWGGSVELDNTSAGLANTVTAWHGTSTTPISGAPKVETVDGNWASFITVGHGTLFHAPWSFNTTSTITSFWFVDGFTFDLISSTVIARTSSAVGVTGTGTVSGNGFATTPGIFSFSTQDPGAGNPTEFSFSASGSAVPEGSTVALLGIGGACLVAGKLRRRKARAL